MYPSLSSDTSYPTKCQYFFTLMHLLENCHVNMPESFCFCDHQISISTQIIRQLSLFYNSLIMIQSDCLNALKLILNWKKLTLAPISARPIFICNKDFPCRGSNFSYPTTNAQRLCIASKYLHIKPLFDIHKVNFTNAGLVFDRIRSTLQSIFLS